LDILSEVLSNSKNSRLYKSLVFQKQIAQDVSAFQYSANLSGMFIVVATAKPNVELDELKKVILDEIDNLSLNDIYDDELERSVNNVKSTYVYSLQKQSTIADQINNYNCNLSEPNSFGYDINRYEKVTKNDVKQVCEKYLSNPFVELRIVPKK
jgi:zinc protease